MQPKNGYKCYTAGKKELFDEEFAKMLSAKKQEGYEIHVSSVVNGEFDHWDIEEYARILAKLDIDVFYIKVSDEHNSRPKYRELVELNGGLHHFAKFIAFDEKTGYQEFIYGDMKIFFEYDPNN